MAGNVRLTVMQLYTEDTTEERGLKETNSGKELRTTKNPWNCLGNG